MQKMQKITQYIRRLFKFYFFSTKKLETQWSLYIKKYKKKPHTIWRDAEEVLAYKAGWIKKLR